MTVTPGYQRVLENGTTGVLAFTFTNTDTAGVYFDLNQLSFADECDLASADFSDNAWISTSGTSLGIAAPFVGGTSPPGNINAGRGGDAIYYLGVGGAAASITVDVPWAVFNTGQCTTDCDSGQSDIYANNVVASESVSSAFSPPQTLVYPTTLNLINDANALKNPKTSEAEIFVSDIPEPASVGMLGIALTGLCLGRWRRR